MNFPIRSSLCAPLLAGLSYFLLATGTTLLAVQGKGVATFWPADALIVALMVDRPSRRWGPLLLATFMGNMFANILVRGDMAGAVLFALANVAGIAVATVTLVKLDARRARSSIMLGFLFWGGLIAPVVSALGGATAAYWIFGADWSKVFLTWAASVSLGMMIFYPFFRSLFNGDYAGWFRTSSRPERFEAAVLLSLTALLSSLIFGLMHIPALFLIFAPIAFITFRHGWIVTKLAVMIVAMIGALCTSMGLGPISASFGSADAVQFLQVFLAVLMMTQMPMARALANLRGINARLEESERSVRLLASEASILMLKFDLEGRCIAALGATELFERREHADLVGAGLGDLAEEGALDFRRAHERAIDFPGDSHVIEFRAFRGSGRWLAASFRATFSPSGKCMGTLATVHDVTDRKLQELALARTALADSLTGILNRAGFLLQLDDAIARHRGECLNLAMIDVDRFKLINDNAGHQAGDAVLSEIARRITGEVRSTDVVARLGGDEFVILLVTPDWQRAADICQRVVGAVGMAPVALPGGGTISTGISCGVARYQRGMTREELLHAADTALYEAKRAGRNQMKLA